MTSFAWTIAIWLAFEWVLRVAALFVVPRGRKPTAGLAWLMLIFLAPVPGWLAFLVIGSYKLPRRRRDMQKTLDGRIQDALKVMRKNSRQAPIVDAAVPTKYAQVAALVQSLTHFPVFSRNSMTLLPDYDATIQRIIDDINTATHYVYIEYYILALDATTEPLFAALEAAVERGVSVRVMYDAYGSRKFPHFKETLQRLQGSGVNVQAMLPLTLPGKNHVRPDLRNHRKLVVVDGVVGFTGSLNLIARDYHRSDDIVYDELTVRAEGPIVQQLRAVFLTDWYSETSVIPTDQGVATEEIAAGAKGDVLAQLVPSGPGYDDENNLKVFNAVLYKAQKSVTIVNPYFVPDESLIVALISAAKRGVRVKLVNSEAIDQPFVAHAQRSYYEEMLRAGVEIYLYKAPTLLHSKYMVVDDDLSLVGSSNMDIRSFELNHELTMVLYDKQATARLQAITNEYLRKAKKVDPQSWFARPPRQQLFDNIARLTSALQ